MRRLRKLLGVCDAGEMSSEELNSGDTSEKCDHLVDDIAQLTKNRTQSDKSLTQNGPGNAKLPVSTLKMIFGREANYSRNGKFSLADKANILNRYLPINGPWCVDRIQSRAYISQFSVDGALFTAAFQVYIFISF